MFFNKFKKGQFGFRIVTDHADQGRIYVPVLMYKYYPSHA